MVPVTSLSRGALLRLSTCPGAGQAATTDHHRTTRTDGAGLQRRTTLDAGMAFVSCSAGCDAISCNRRLEQLWSGPGPATCRPAAIQSDISAVSVCAAIPARCTIPTAVSAGTAESAAVPARAAESAAVPARAAVSAAVPGTAAAIPAGTETLGCRRRFHRQQQQGGEAESRDLADDKSVPGPGTACQQRLYRYTTVLCCTWILQVACPIRVCDRNRIWGIVADICDKQGEPLARVLRHGEPGMNMSSDVATGVMAVAGGCGHDPGYHHPWLWW